MTLVLRRAYGACQTITRRHSRSFYFASYLLPPVRRQAAYALYAFCRTADEAVDDPSTSLAERIHRLDAVRDRLDRVFCGRESGLESDAALADVVQRFGVPRRPFEELLTGMEVDLKPLAFKTSDELLRYCHLAAGVVGELLLPVLGASGESARLRANDLGVAMQLTNILRDVGEDLQRGRIYLPQSELTAFGLSHDDVRAHRTGPEWSAFMQAQIARARRYYARAGEGVPLIRSWSGRLCTQVMRFVYGDILRVIERNGYDVFSRRAATTPTRKIALLTLALLGVLPRNLRAPGSLPPAHGVLLLPREGS